MGMVAERFPLSFTNSISIVLRVIEAPINHVMSAHPFGDAESKDTVTNNVITNAKLTKTAINYTISDVSVLKIESLYNGESARQTYADLLVAGKLSTSYTDFEFSSYELTNKNSIVATMPVALRDLRMVLIAFTLKDSVISKYKGTTPYGASDYVFYNTRYNHPWIAGGLNCFAPAIKDIWISINGQGRLPLSAPQTLPSTDFAPAFTRSCIKQLIGNSAEYDQGYLDALAG